MRVEATGVAGGGAHAAEAIRATTARMRLLVFAVVLFGLAAAHVVPLARLLGSETLVAGPAGTHVSAGLAALAVFCGCVTRCVAGTGAVVLIGHRGLPPR